ncbi:MAG: WD40/YVTN/BNR-like repeat-containing protein, partial [Blastocatellia bacterium]
CAPARLPGTWEALQTGTGDSFYGINFVNDQVGWVNGQTDRAYVPPGDNSNSNSAAKPKPTPTPTRVSEKESESKDPLKANQGFEVLHTTDGGKTWTQIADQFKYKIRSVWFIDPQTGWALTIDRDILHTVDGGATWSTQRKAGTVKVKLVGNLKTPVMDAPEQIDHVYFKDRTHGWAWGGGQKSTYAEQPGTFLTTVNGGANWNEVPFPFTQSIDSIFFMDNNHAWASTKDGLYKSTDGGVTWAKITTRLPELAFNSMCFVNTDVGFVVGRSGRIARTTDGGRTWWKMLDIKPEFVMEDIYFRDEKHGWAVGRRDLGHDETDGAVLYTPDGGDSWLSAGSPVQTKLMDIEFSGKDSGWISGLNGAVLKFSASNAK